MLKNIRVLCAAFFMVSLTLLFLDYTGAIHAYLGWIARVQLVPALLSLNILVFAVLVLITLLFGRIYCSVLCPLGIFQDIVSRIAGIFKKNRFSFWSPCKAFVGLRFVLLGLFAIALMVNIVVVVVLIEPYSAYGRMVAQLFGPVYMLGNNLLAYFAERMNSYAFFTVDIWLRSVSALVVAILTFVIIAAFALKSGRGYCNTICPVGTFLGVIARFSLIKLRISKDKCVSCGVCAKNCKASCLDSNELKIDYFRCIICFNCMKRCPKKAMRYGISSRKSAEDAGGTMNVISAAESEKSQDKLTNGGNVRRGFISGIAVLMFGFLTRKAYARVGFNFDGGVAPLEPKRAPSRSQPIIPPGADNIRNFRRRCTGCQLCVTTCPNNVLRPSNNISSFMQPHLSFERGFCRPECVKCSLVCPTGAIRPITAAEKSSIQIGYAVWQKELCLVITDDVNCDLCSRRCPTAAITMIQYTIGARQRRIPMVDTNRCIGCGACEHLCPVRPYSAIFVEGIDTHRTV